MESWLTAMGDTEGLGAMAVLYSLSLSFVLGLVLATVYRWTHQSFSYARSFLHTMVLATIVITVMIMAIGNNMARGIGIMGAMAFVRFRTPIRDPRDIIFLFAALSIGIASGARVYEVAVIGTLYFCFTAMFLSWSPFASRREFEGLLRFMLPPDSPSHEHLQTILTRYTSSTEMVAMREAIQGEVQEYSYQIRLLDPSYKTDLVDSLSKLDDISEVSLVMQRTTVEI